MHTFTFAHPLYLLWLIPACLTLWLITLKTRASLAPDQVHQSLLLRCLAAALVILAAASPVLTGPSRDQSVMYLIDASRSISPQQRASEFAWVTSAIRQKPSGDSVGVEEFGGDTSLLIRPTTAPGALVNHVSVNQDSTDIGKAISDSAAVMNSSEPRQIVVLSDGNETSGSSIQAASGGVPVSFVNAQKLFGSAQPAEASIARSDAPTTVRDGEPTLLRVVVESNVAQTVSLQAKCDDTSLANVSQAIGIGKSVIAVPVVFHGGGIRQVAFNLRAPQDTVIDNNVGDVAVKVIGKPRVLYLTDSASQVEETIERVLARQSIGLDIEAPLNAPTNAAGFAAYDSVVVSNTVASEMTAQQQDALQSAVRDYGDGFGMIGGPNSFIGGGWAETPVEQILPVEMKLPTKLLPPPADIVVVLDASGSMSAEEDGIQKVQLAARAAVSLLGNLQPDDRVCVLAVTEEAVVTVPFSSPKDALAARSDIEGLEAGGGGIDCLTGLNAAYNLLELSTAPIKHVIICPDTTDSEEQEHCVARAAQELTTHRITTSVCGIGEAGDPDVPFQKSVAAAGGGQLFVVSKATDLPHFFQRDLVNLEIPPVRLGQFNLALDSSDRVVGGLGAVRIPELLGYNISLAKPSATVPIKSAQFQEPIFAYQTYGLGRTFAYTSDDIGVWSKPWTSWPGYSPFWARVMRWSLRSEKPAAFDAFVDLPSNSSTGHIVVDAFDPAGNFLNSASFIANVSTPGGSSVPLTLTQTAPGRYEAPFDGASVGGYLVSVSHSGHSDDGVQTLGVSRAYSPEFAQSTLNLPLMASVSEASGGKIFDQPADVWRFRPGTDPELFNLTSLCLILGMLVFVLDIAWRLLGLRVQTQRMRELSLAAAQRAQMATSSVAGFVRERASDGPTAAELAPKMKMPAKIRTDKHSGSSTPGGKKQTVTSDEADAILRGRRATTDEDPFPLVANLDEMRRRARARERE